MIPIPARFGALAQDFAPWIGAMTMIVAAMAAYGQVDRGGILLRAIGAMQSNLEQILGLEKEAPASLIDLRHRDRRPAGRRGTKPATAIFERSRSMGELIVDSAETKDQLGFAPMAQILVDVIRDTPPPFTIGVFGAWGSGKI
jgi:hypothetical protein